MQNSCELVESEWPNSLHTDTMSVIVEIPQVEREM